MPKKKNPSPGKKPKKQPYKKPFRPILDDQQMDEIRMLLPTEAFKQNKYLFWELLNKAKRGEVEDIQKFQSHIENKVERVDELLKELVKKTKGIKKSQEGGYLKSTMKAKFLKRVMDRLTGKKEEEIEGFPLPDIKKRPIKPDKQVVEEIRGQEPSLKEVPKEPKVIKIDLPIESEPVKPITTPMETQKMDSPQPKAAKMPLKSPPPTKPKEKPAPVKLKIVKPVDPPKKIIFFQRKGKSP